MFKLLLDKLRKPRIKFDCAVEIKPGNAYLIFVNPIVFDFDIIGRLDIPDWAAVTFIPATDAKAIMVHELASKVESSNLAAWGAK